MRSSGALDAERSPAALDEPIELHCSTCAADARLPLDEPARFRDAARSFFEAHAECTTSIDLDGRLLQGWAI